MEPLSLKYPSPTTEPSIASCACVAPRRGIRAMRSAAAGWAQTTRYACSPMSARSPPWSSRISICMTTCVYRRSTRVFCPPEPRRDTPRDGAGGARAAHTDQRAGWDGCRRVAGVGARGEPPLADALPALAPPVAKALHQAPHQSHAERRGQAQDESRDQRARGVGGDSEVIVPGRDEQPPPKAQASGRRRRDNPWLRIWLSASR